MRAEETAEEEVPTSFMEEELKNETKMILRKEGNDKQSSPQYFKFFVFILMC